MPDHRRTLIDARAWLKRIARSRLLIPLLIVANGLFLVCFSSIPVVHQWRCGNQPTNPNYLLGYVTLAAQEQLRIPTRPFYSHDWLGFDEPQNRGLIEYSTRHIILAMDTVAATVIDARTDTLHLTWYSKWQLLSLVSFDGRQRQRQITASDTASVFAKLWIPFGDLATFYGRRGSVEDRRTEIRSFFHRLNAVVDSTRRFSADSLADATWEMASYHHQHPLSETRSRLILLAGLVIGINGLWTIVQQARQLYAVAQRRVQPFVRRGNPKPKLSWTQCLFVNDDTRWLERLERRMQLEENTRNRLRATQEREDREVARQQERDAANRERDEQRVQELLARLDVFRGQVTDPDDLAAVQAKLDIVADSQRPVIERWQAMWTAEESYRRRTTPLSSTPADKPPAPKTAPRPVETKAEAIARMWPAIESADPGDLEAAVHVQFVALRRRYLELGAQASEHQRYRLVERLYRLLPTSGNGNGSTAAKPPALVSLEELWTRLAQEVQPHLTPGLCPRHLSAILLFGLMQPGRRSSVRSTNVYIKLESMVDNVRRKLKEDFDSDDLRQALAWLERNNVLIYHKLGNTVALNTHLHGRRGTLTIPDPTDAGREVIMAVKRLNMDLIRATGP